MKNYIMIQKRKDDMRRKTPLDKIKCRICKKLFVPRKTTTKNCSKICMHIDTRNRIERRTEDRRKIVAKKLSIIPKKPCKTCGKLFSPINPSRINCSNKCALHYNYYRKRAKKENKQECMWKKFAISKPIDEKKGELRNEINRETLVFLKNGGTIERLSTLPSPEVPSVGSSEWNWENKAGLGGFFTTEELVETDSILEEIIKSELG